ncbi:MAG: acyl carrier protein [Thermoanaerobaculia bacterium]|nr:acyl carrier protein [Thermoanaerobaculia bacterium]
MKKSEFLALIDDILEEPAGTVRSDQILEEFPAWDSLAMVSFIAVVNGQFGQTLQAEKLTNAKSVEDLLALVGKHIEE